MDTGEVRVMNWNTDEPRSKHACVKLSVGNNHQSWNTDDCFNQNYCICQNCKLPNENIL